MIRISVSIQGRCAASLLIALLSTLSVMSAFAGDRATESCIEPPTGGLTAWWGGNGNAGDVFASHNGTLVDDATFVEGLVEKAFQFDGEGDRVDMISISNRDSVSMLFSKYTMGQIPKRAASC